MMALKGYHEERKTHFIFYTPTCIPFTQHSNGENDFESITCYEKQVELDAPSTEMNILPKLHMDTWIQES
jgi:hypothetical protein